MNERATTETIVTEIPTRLTADEWADITVGLAAEFPADEVGTYDSGHGVFKYIDARAVFERLDVVVGPAHWSDSFRVLDTATGAVECTLTIHGVSKSDIGYPNTPIGSTNKEGKRIDSTEPLKDAVSDALKRAAVHWGIGRYLYGKAGDKTSGKPSFSSTRSGSSGNGHGGSEASEKQINFITQLARRHGVPLPNSGNLTGLPKDVASRWIETLQADQATAQLTGGGAPPAGSFTEDGEYQDEPVGAEPHQESQPAPTTAPVENGEKPASDNQKATIVKLSRLLGHPEEPDDLTSKQASERITALSREYNERRAGVKT